MTTRGNLASDETTEYVTVQNGDLLYMERGGASGKITTLNFFNSITEDLTLESGSPSLTWFDTNHTGNQRRVQLQFNAGVLGMSLFDDSQVQIAIDYAAVFGASGVTEHSWRIEGNEVWELTDTGAILRQGDLGFVERSGPAVTATAGQGRIYVKNDAPNSLMFVDDAGTETILAGRAHEGSTLTTSGDDIVISDAIPPEATRIELDFHSVSLNGTDDILIQLGTGVGVFVTSGYLSSSAASNPSAIETGENATGFLCIAGLATSTMVGGMVITKVPGSNEWMAKHTCSVQDPAPSFDNTTVSGAGTVDAAATVDRIRISSTGAGTFDGGFVVWRAS